MSRPASKLLFLGTGSSTGVPRGACIVQDPVSCHVCKLATQGQPETNRNWRSNPSVMLQYRPNQQPVNQPEETCRSSSGQSQDSITNITGESSIEQPVNEFINIQIDCGKTFRESMLRWFPRHRVQQIDRLYLSHEHADACFGLDDLRSIQRFDEVKGIPITPCVPIYLSDHSFQSISQRFPYLTLHSLKNSTIRRVAQLDFVVIEDLAVDHIDNTLSVQTLPVMHGHDYRAWGFLFHSVNEPGQNIVYISDVSQILPETDAILMNLSKHCVSGRACTSCAIDQSTNQSFYESNNQSNSSPIQTDKPWPVFVEPHNNDSGIHLLVIDSLFSDKKHPTHFNLHDAVDCIRRYRPHHALLIGMSDDHEYYAINQQLEKLLVEEGLHVRMSYDGMSLDVHL